MNHLQTPRWLYTEPIILIIHYSLELLLKLEKGKRNNILENFLKSLYKYYMRYLKAGLDGNVDRNDKTEKIPSELQIDASVLKDPPKNDNVSKHKKRQFHCSTPLQVVLFRKKVYNELIF